MRTGSRTAGAPAAALRNDRGSRAAPPGRRRTGRARRLCDSGVHVPARPARAGSAGASSDRAGTSQTWASESPNSITGRRHRRAAARRSPPRRARTTRRPPRRPPRTTRPPRSARTRPRGASPPPTGVREKPRPQDALELGSWEACLRHERGRPDVGRLDRPRQTGERAVRRPAPLRRAIDEAPPRERGSRRERFALARHLEPHLAPLRGGSRE